MKLKNKKLLSKKDDPLTVGQFKEFIKDLPDNAGIYIRPINFEGFGFTWAHRAEFEADPEDKVKGSIVICEAKVPTKDEKKRLLV
jgi:hypothetical protein